MENRVLKGQDVDARRLRTRLLGHLEKSASINALRRLDGQGLA